jgi:hypothetical protein
VSDETTEVSAPPSDAPDPASKVAKVRRLRRWIPVVATLVTLAFFGAFVILGFIVHEQGQQLDRLRAAGEKNAAQIQKVAGNDNATDVATLQKRSSETATKLAAVEKKLKTVCDERVLATTRAELEGQWTTDPGANYTYYGNLQLMLAAACGPAPSD